MTAYATRRDLYRYGLPRGAMGSTARECASVTASTDLLELDQHGFEDDDEVVVRALEGGTLAAPLVAGTTYYVIRESDSTFKLAATAGGGAINLTTNGAGMIVASQLPVEAVLEAVSRMADTYMPHLVPLTGTIPIVVVDTVATISAKRLQHLSGARSETTEAFEANAWKQLERWAKGVPIRDANISASSNTAVTASATAADVRGWGTGCLP